MWKHKICDFLCELFNILSSNCTFTAKVPPPPRLPHFPLPCKSVGVMVPVCTSEDDFGCRSWLSTLSRASLARAAITRLATCDSRLCLRCAVDTYQKGEASVLAQLPSSSSWWTVCYPHKNEICNWNEDYKIYIYKDLYSAEYISQWSGSLIWDKAEMAMVAKGCVGCIALFGWQK